MKRYNMWIGIGIFAVIIISILIYQQYRKQEFVQYLEQVEECFQGVDSLQELSLQANQAGMSGDHVREIELFQTMTQRSEEFLIPFQKISVRSNSLKKMHEKLLELNEDTHTLLIKRSEAIRQIQDESTRQMNNPSQSAKERQQNVDEFWALQEKNQTLFRSLSDALHKYGKRVGVDPAKYLKHFL